jgi:bis(5'-nucleosidyl)-tetraphosphatase
MNHWDQSFGVIPLFRKGSGWNIFLIQHAHGRYWGFPKGHAEAGESELDAASRELKEETNLDIVRLLQQEPLQEQYQFVVNKRRIHKRVLYFVAEVSGSVVLQKKEISNGMWLPITEAFEQVTHSEGRAILACVEKILARACQM